MPPGALEGKNEQETAGAVDQDGGETLEDYEDVRDSRAWKTVRNVAVWIAFAALIWVIWGYVGDFKQQKQTLDAQAQTSEVASATPAASVTTTVTDLIATVRSDVSLRSQAATSSAVVATSHDKSTLDVLAKQGQWLRVKDAAGHLGWVPNDTQYLAVTAKPAKFKPKAAK